MEASKGIKGLNHASTESVTSVARPKGTHPLLIMALFGGMIIGLIYVGSTSGQSHSGGSGDSLVALIDHSSR